MLPITVTDSHGRRYTLGRLIGQGGQGEVFELKDVGGRLAVKLLRASGEMDRERFRRRIQAVFRLHLEGLPIAAPKAVLSPPHVGYVMELAAGMSSLQLLSRPPSDGRSVSRWYVETGGLRKRLQILGAVMDVFTRLHGGGLVYGDPSPSNVLFASDDDGCRVFLIDADNLNLERDSAVRRVFTPGYASPELIRGVSGPNTLTDAFGLAVMAFEVLSLVHPFLGDYVHDGEPELEEAAFRGEMPWIEHRTNKSNCSSRGVERVIVVSPELMKLFGRMFEDGLNDPLARPGLGEWAGLFGQAADVTVQCPQCQATYYGVKQTQCPWCEHKRPEISLASIHLWDPEIPGNIPGGFVTAPTKVKRSVGTMVLAMGMKLQICGRHVYPGVSLEQSERPLVEVTATKVDAVRLRNMTAEPLLLIKHSGATRTIDSLVSSREKLLPISSKEPHWYLHFGPLEALHRAVVFRPRGLNI